jgi:hypothetical protein
MATQIESDSQFPIPRRVGGNFGHHRRALRIPSIATHPKMIQIKVTKSSPSVGSSSNVVCLTHQGQRRFHDLGCMVTGDSSAVVFEPRWQESTRDGVAAMGHIYTPLAVLTVSNRAANTKAVAILVFCGHSD